MLTSQLASFVRIFRGRRYLKFVYLITPSVILPSIFLPKLVRKSERNLTSSDVQDELVFFFLSYSNVFFTRRELSVVHTV